MSDGYVKNGRYVKTSGMARTIPHGTLAEIEAMIANGTLKEGDACAITDDYEEIIGSTDISEIADGTLTGAVDELSSELPSKQNKTDNSLATTSKTIVDAINEVNTNVNNLFSTDGNSIDSTSDWNTLKNSGLYKKLVGTANANIPKSGHYFYCFVIKHSNVALTQIAIPYSTGNVNTDVYVRTLYSSTWTAWKSLTNADRYATIDVTSPSTANTYASVNYPTGFNSHNCILINYLVKNGSDNVIGMDSRMSGNYCELTTGGIRVWSAASSGSLSRAGKITLMRTDI